MGIETQASEVVRIVQAKEVLKTCPPRIENNDSDDDNNDNALNHGPLQ